MKVAHSVFVYKEQSVLAVLSVCYMYQAKHMYEVYAAEIYSQSQICLCSPMDMAVLKSRSSKLHSTPNSAMNLELSQGQ